MTVETFADLYVRYFVPGFKVFLFFLLVMLVLAFWAKAKEGKLMDLPSLIFNGTVTVVYKFFYYIFIAVLAVFTFVWRTSRIIFATIRDFFMSRI